MESCYRTVSAMQISLFPNSSFRIVYNWWQRLVRSSSQTSRLKQVFFPHSYTAFPQSNTKRFQQFFILAQFNDTTLYTAPNTIAIPSKYTTFLPMLWPTIESQSWLAHRHAQSIIQLPHKWNRHFFYSCRQASFGTPRRMHSRYRQLAHT